MTANENDRDVGDPVDYRAPPTPQEHVPLLLTLTPQGEVTCEVILSILGMHCQGPERGTLLVGDLHAAYIADAYPVNRADGTQAIVAVIDFQDDIYEKARYDNEVVASLCQQMNNIIINTARDEVDKMPKKTTKMQRAQKAVKSAFKGLSKTLNGVFGKKPKKTKKTAHRKTPVQVRPEEVSK